MDSQLYHHAPNYKIITVDPVIIIHTHHMGTRHVIKVRSRKIIKVSQYGQWDGDSAWVGISKFIQTKMKYDKFVEKIDKLEFVPDELVDKLSDTAAEFSRDTSYKILEMIQESDITYVVNSCEDDIFCIEYVYEIDLDNKTVSINNDVAISFENFTEEYILKHFGDKEEDEEDDEKEEKEKE
jgi:hypothetical protein